MVKIGGWLDQSPNRKIKIRENNYELRINKILSVVSNSSPKVKTLYLVNFLSEILRLMSRSHLFPVTGCWGMLLWRMTVLNLGSRHELTHSLRLILPFQVIIFSPFVCSRTERKITQNVRMWIRHEFGFNRSYHNVSLFDRFLELPLILYWHYEDKIGMPSRLLLNCTVLQFRPSHTIFYFSPIAIVNYRTWMRLFHFYILTLSSQKADLTQNTIPRLILYSVLHEFHCYLAVNSQEIINDSRYPYNQRRENWGCLNPLKM